MTGWVINCPGAAPGPGPRSLFLLYDKKERRNRGEAGINYGNCPGTSCRPILFSYPSLNPHLFPGPSELTLAKPFGKELGKLWGMPPKPFTAKYEGHRVSSSGH